MEWLAPQPCPSCIGIGRAGFVIGRHGRPILPESLLMSTQPVQRSDAPHSKSDASASGPGFRPESAELPSEQHDRIAKRAYELAAQRGFDAGHELEDWLQAEREIEAGPPRNTPPDKPLDQVKTSSNED
jgi:hypothetical protein